MHTAHSNKFHNDHVSMLNSKYLATYAQRRMELTNFENNLPGYRKYRIRLDNRRRQSRVINFAETTHLLHRPIVNRGWQIVLVSLEKFK